MGISVQEKVREDMTLMKLASFGNVQADLLPEDMSIIFPVPDRLTTGGDDAAITTITRGHCRSLRMQGVGRRPRPEHVPKVHYEAKSQGFCSAPVFKLKESFIALRAHAPAEASKAAVSWDTVPNASQHVKENWHGWKWKMMKKNNGEKKKLSLSDRRVALEEDVAQLQSQLKTERAVRQGLERALGHNKRISAPLRCEVPSSTYSPKAKELITEIASLETEVASLEQHVLSLYRKVLDGQMSATPPLPLEHVVPTKLPSPPVVAPEPDSMQSPSTPQPRLFSRISLKRKCNALSSSQHRRNGSSPGTPNNEPEERAVNGSSGGAQTKSRHVSLLGGAFNCIDGSSADESSQQLVPAPPAHAQTPIIHASEPARVDVRLGSSSRGNSKKELFPPSPRSAPLPLLVSGCHSAPVLETYSRKLYPESPRVYAGSPNRLSEELVRCMAAIYCKLADPPLSHNSGPISPVFSSSSSASSTTTTSSPRGFSCESWSPRWGTGGAADSSSEVLSLADPFQLKHRKGDVLGAYNFAVEVPWICVDKDRLNYAARALRNFRLMVEQLENVDPGLMKHDEKMAFWINVYNALMMHAYLAYGIPRSHLKRIALVQKASYKVGPHSINAHTIEHCILGCRARRPTQWLQTLFTTGPRFKAGDERKAYAIERPEPLACFALCCGGRSDPAIRVYTAKHVRQELEVARREYLQASIGIRSGSRVLLPRILEWYSRELSVSPANLLDWVSQFVTDKQQVAIKQCLQLRSHRNAAHSIEWLSYNSGFRYIFVRDLARLSPRGTQ